MKFALSSEATGAPRLCALPEGDGHRVHTYALEKAELPKEVPKAGCLRAAYTVRGLGDFADTGGARRRTQRAVFIGAAEA